MATKKCPNGHQYDSAIYGDNCPFCPTSGDHTIPTSPTSSPGPWRQGHTKPVNPVGDNGSTIPYPGVGDGSGERTIVKGFPVGTNVSNGRRVIGVLVSYSADPAGMVFNVYEGRNMIGRAHTCDISFHSDGQMSGEHFLILYVEAEGKFWIEDQKSSNGTYVNGNFIRGLFELHTNDIITAGDTKMIFLGIPKF